MVDTEPVSRLGLSDAPACQPLSDEAGWNQMPADWEMMLQNGQGFAIRRPEGPPQASALALPMGARAGWISMVLVTARCRRQGYGKRLMAACIDWLEQDGRVPFLDATPAGQPLYRSMGFAPVLELRRMSGTGGGLADRTGLRAAAPEDLGWMSALDRDVLGADRSFVLADLMTRPGAVALVREAQDGFVLSRAGRTATQIGPVIAPTAEIAGQLLGAALAATPGPVLIDVLAQHPLGETLEARGFTEQRPFLRMAKGLKEQTCDTARLFAAAGPELG